MNKTEILNIVNEPSKHIQIVKIDGKDNIVYSSKFVELLELIPTMLTKDDMVAMLIDLQLEIREHDPGCGWEGYADKNVIDCIIQERINSLEGEQDPTPQI